MYATLSSTARLAESAQITDRLAVGFYLAYAALAVSLVLWLSRTLSRHGSVFLNNVFDSDELAGAVNHLLVVGFLLLNLGYALTLYKVQSSVNLSEAYNTLIARLGTLLASLGLIHLLNMAVFWKIRHSRSSTASPAQFPAPYSFVPPSSTSQVTPSAPMPNAAPTPMDSTTFEGPASTIPPMNDGHFPRQPNGPGTFTPPPAPGRG